MATCFQICKGGSDHYHLVINNKNRNLLRLKNKVFHFFSNSFKLTVLRERKIMETEGCDWKMLQLDAQRE